MINSRQKIKGVIPKVSVAITLMAATGVLLGTGTLRAAPPAKENKHSVQSSRPFTIPSKGEIPVAIVISAHAEVLDFCGPLEVFANALTPDGHSLFKPYIVAASIEPVTVGGGMRVLPDYTFTNAPAPKVVVIPAMGESPVEMTDWIRRVSDTTDITMSVCTGAFVLAQTGLLDGRPATTHHGGYFRLAGAFPKVQLRRGARYVETGNLATAGGVSSGIDLALRVVERYAGREQAQTVADLMEYQGQGWLNPDSNDTYARVPQSTEQKPKCPVCGMLADRSIHLDYDGKTYYFCSEAEKVFFHAHPAVAKRFLAEDAALRAKKSP